MPVDVVFDVAADSVNVMIDLSTTLMAKGAAEAADPTITVRSIGPEYFLNIGFESVSPQPWLQTRDWEAIVGANHGLELPLFSLDGSPIPYVNVYGNVLPDKGVAEPGGQLTKFTTSYTMDSVSKDPRATEKDRAAAAKRYGENGSLVTEMWIGADDQVHKYRQTETRRDGIARVTEMTVDQLGATVSITPPESFVPYHG